MEEDHTSTNQNTESMAGKIQVRVELDANLSVGGGVNVKFTCSSLTFIFFQALEGEVCRLSQSLESSLLEKGEIASRLNSTQDEVRQMRTGIEKLQVRIESDERKKKKMGEFLKGISQWFKKIYKVISHSVYL